MKGIIFNLLESFITENFGEDKYEEILSGCDLKTSGPFVGPGTYPDEDLFAIVGRAVEVSGIKLPDALRMFGRFCVPRLVEKYPNFTRPYTHPKPFLKTVESVVHLEVKKLYEDAEPPSFIYDDPAPERLIIKYMSARRLCHFMEGLIEGVADLYGSPIQYSQKVCMLNGGEHCEFELTFSPEGKPGS